MNQPFNPSGTKFAGRGFAGMDRERQREIASQGGRAAHASGNAHQFTSEEARAAGMKRHANAKAKSLATILAGAKESQKGDEGLGAKSTVVPANGGTEGPKENGGV